MFRRLAARVPNGAAILVSLHPIELIGLLEQAWNMRMHPPPPPSPVLPGHPTSSERRSRNRNSRFCGT